MNREQAELLLTDFLAGEITPENLDKLESYQEEHPEFAESRRIVEAAWGLAPETDRVLTVPELPAEILSQVENSRQKKILRLEPEFLHNLAAAGDGNSDFKPLKPETPEDSGNGLKGAPDPKQN